MYKKIYSNPDIYSIYVPLSKSPLKNVNCYVIKTDSENLIIDTGFNLKECYRAITDGLNEIGVEIEKSRMFLTHLHTDHIGLAPHIMKGGIIYMSKIDYTYITDDAEIHSWNVLDRKFISEGFPMELIKNIHTKKDSSDKYAPDMPFRAAILNDGDKIHIGPYELTCVLTPGHTPGHMCLYMEKEEIMFLGDHVLFDITPNITFWAGVKNSLKDYIESLDKIKNFKVKIPLPAHRQVDKDFYDRVDEIKKHHFKRLDECFGIIKQNPGLTAYNITGLMKWSIRCNSWLDFPTTQKWFAVGEAIAHMDYLRAINKIYRRFENGIYHYYAF